MLAQQVIAVTNKFWVSSLDFGTDGWGGGGCVHNYCTFFVGVYDKYLEHINHLEISQKLLEGS